ncbi:ATP-binding cassette domain-containing protein, partial [Mycetocola reblochoni]
DTLDEVFPGHGISVLDRSGEMPMAQRQMVEIARALCTDRLRLLILDEPTESLGVDAAEALYRYLHRRTADGVSAVLVSHRMHEVVGHSDRILVMKDGSIVGQYPGGTTAESTLLAAMGGEVSTDTGTLERVEAELDDQEQPAAAREGAAVLALTDSRGRELTARPGEIIGLAGLAGQGQEGVLARLWAPGLLSRSVTVPSSRAYVPGDRQVSGIFPLWTVAENLTIAATRALGRFGFVSGARKRELASTWVDMLRVRGGAAAPITSLSGGNQQKVLIARAFAADAELVLLDDPFRGVDVATKNEIYTLMKAEARSGRTIVWYSTDNKEMAHCDRVYVFRAGRIVSEMPGSDATEQRIIADSFDETEGELR